MYVPRKFCRDQPAITYTHECLRQVEISHHPVARQLPTRTNGPSIQPLPNSADFRTLQVRRGFPTSLDASIEARLPPISLHVHSFQDATVVGLAWPHMLMDGVGVASLMRSWSLVMAGEEDQVPVVTGARHDVLSDLPPADEGHEEFLAAKGLLRGVGLVRFLGGQLWNRLTGPGKVCRAMYLPKASYDMLLGRIKDEVSRIATDSAEKLYVSDADALTGWILQSLALLESKPRPFTILTLVNSRYRLGRLLDPNGVYLQNMVLMTSTIFSAQEARGAAAALALSHREQVAEQTTPSRILSFLQWLGRQIDSGRNPIALCGQADSVFFFVNALTKLDLIRGVDFGPAVLRQGEAANTRDNPPGTVTWLGFKEVNAEIAPINALTVIGKDHSDGTWYAGNLSPQAWEHLERQLELLR